MGECKRGKTQEWGHLGLYQLLLKITHVRKALITLEDTITPRSAIIFLTQLYCELNFNMNFGKDEQHSNHSKDS